MPLIMDAMPPGSGIGELLPSAPAVVLPTTSAPGAVRNAIVVYSAWLCDTSSTRITTRPPYSELSGSTATGSVHVNAPGFVMSPFVKRANGVRCVTSLEPSANTTNSLG
jgi:hypothetical protein